MQEIDAWEHWSYDWLQTPPSDVMSSEMVIGPLGLPIRYIQQQRLSDLYWQFLAEWEWNGTQVRAHAHVSTLSPKDTYHIGSMSW